MIAKRHFALTPLLVLVWTIALTTLAQAREWVDAEGKHTTEAELVRIAGKKVELRKPDGKVISVPIAKLSKADRDYLANLRKDNSGSASTGDVNQDRFVTEYVYQRGARLSSADFEKICANKALRKLDLRGAPLSDRDMPKLANLTNLEEFRLNNHTISSKGFEVLAHLRNLKVLGIESATGPELQAIFPLIKDCPLVELDISGSGTFTGVGLEILNCKKTLRKLDASCFRGQIDEKGMASFRDFTALTHLDLHGHTKIKKGIKYLEGMAELESLNLYGCISMPDEDLSSLFRKLTKLASLNMGFCWAQKGHGLVYPASLTDLYLVESKQLTDAAFENLPCKDKLVHVNLFQCLPLTDKGVAAFRDMKQLRSFNVGCIRALTNESLKTIGTNTGLTNLNVSDNDHFDDEGLAYLKNLKQLEVLNLWHTKGLTGSCFKHFAGMTKLVELNLADCHHLESRYFSNLKALPSLENLYLDNCLTLEDEALAKLAGKTGLRELTVRGCENLTDQSLAHLKTLTGLEYLDISNCVGFSDEAVRAIRKALPDCEVVR